MSDFDTYVNVLRETSEDIKSGNLNDENLQSKLLILKDLNKDLIKETNELCNMTAVERRVLHRLINYIYSLLPEREQLIVELGQYSAAEKLYYQCCPFETTNIQTVKDDEDV